MMVMIKKIIVNFPIGFFIYLLLGGLSYTGGTYFFKKKTMFLSHFIWHIFVLAGAILQFVAFYKYIYLI
ncbi:MAG: PAQR family membrane homeostasis protein TrhA, partial [Anaerococcus sp.]